MSIEAMSHALGLDVGNATRKLVLIGFANHAHKDGRNTWAAVDTVAEYANCDARTVQRHLGKLLEDGYLREGDPDAYTGRATGRRRPIVYDVAMSEAQRAAWAAAYDPASTRRARDAASGSKGGKRTAAIRAAEQSRGDNLSPHDEAQAAENPQVTRGVNLSPHAEPGFEPTWGDKTAPREVTETPMWGDTAVSPEPSLNRTEEPSNYAAPGKPDAQDGDEEWLPLDGVTTTEPDEVTRLRLADDITRRFTDWYVAKHGPIVKRGRSSPYVALRKMVGECLAVGYDEGEITRALAAVEQPLPQLGRLQSALVEVRSGRRPGARGPGNRHVSSQPDEVRAAQRAAFEGRG